MATSQRPLGLDGETVYVLEPLPIADSIVLFTSRAEEIRTQFVLDEDTAAVVEEVCRCSTACRCHRARRGEGQVVVGARDRPAAGRPLRTAPRPHEPAPERRRTCRRIAWSYELLFPDDMRGLWALSCFAGGAPLAAAEHVVGVLGVPRHRHDVVGRLIDGRW